MAQETIDFIHAFCEDDEYSRQLPGKEDYVSIEKGVHKQKGLVCVISMNCLLHLKKQGSSGRHSVCVCTTHQNTILLVDALNWEVKHKDLVNKVVCNPANCECMMHHCTNCPERNTLHKFLENELSDIDPDFQFHHYQWQTTERASLVTVTLTCEEYKDTLISALNAIRKHLLLAKCQANFLRAKKESLKANEVIVVGNFTKSYQFFVQDETQSYHWSK